MHFACKGPPGRRLMLLDHAPDAGDAILLVPFAAGAWIEADAAGRSYFPGRDDAPLFVRPDTAIRQVVALWLPDAAARAIDAAVPACANTFRPIPEAALAMIVARIREGAGPDGEAAIADILYRASGA
jgi:hypothetical protein